MAKETQPKFELAEFKVNQLSELQNKKAEIQKELKKFKYVEIVDNSSYEEAKKSRTGVRSIRTSLQNEQKEVVKKIKDFITNPVTEEYSKLINDVLPIENKQQEEVTRYEDIKERQREERERLEQNRVDGIKSSIGKFREFWEDKVSKLTFAEIESIKEEYSVAVVEFDRKSLEEYDVLFEQSLNYIDGIFQNKISTLEEQEKIRVDNLLIEEKKAEHMKIWMWENEWTANGSSLKLEDVADMKETFKEAKLKGLKHLQEDFDEKYATMKNRLNQQVEILSKQEEQRLITEKQKAEADKLAKEKAEFEASQLKARTESRVKQLTDLGIHEDVIFDGLGKGEWSNLKHAAENYTDDLWLEQFNWAKEQIALRDKQGEEIANSDSVTVVKEMTKDEILAQYPLTPEEASEIVDLPMLDENPTELKGLIQTLSSDEETWESIFDDYDNYIVNCTKSQKRRLDLDKWLEENYNVPTKK